jgi:subtilase family serine protease
LKALESLMLVLLLAFSVVPLVRADLPAQTVPTSDMAYQVVNPKSGTGSPDLNPLTYCGGLVCYSPDFLRSAYNFPSNLDGTGQTIVVVDAYGSPTLQSDVNLFDQTFGVASVPSLQIFCAPRCPNVNFKGNTQTVQTEVSWSIETSLDVEWAHAMAPGANIVVAVAQSDSFNDLSTAIGLAVSAYPNSILSLSFGTAENLLTSTQISTTEASLQTAASTGITVFAATGDKGATDGQSVATASFPASSPYVTAVGGTMGLPYEQGLAASNCPSSGDCTPSGYGGEQVWNEAIRGVAGGGAPSSIFNTPSFQSGLGLADRTIPDVSYNAAEGGGVLVIWSADPGYYGDSGPLTFVVGGTSAGAPQWAAIAALSNQLSVSQGGGPLGFIDQAIYSIGLSSTEYANDFHDITVLNNRLAGAQIGFNATIGYDFATGWGTPNVTNLLPDLVAAASG